MKVFLIYVVRLNHRLSGKVRNIDRFKGFYTFCHGGTINQVFAIDNRVRYTYISRCNEILVQLFTIVERYVSTGTMIDNSTGSCKARYTYTVIHKYNRTGEQAKPGMHIQLFTDTKELVYTRNQVHIYSYSQIQ